MRRNCGVDDGQSTPLGLAGLLHRDGSVLTSLSSTELDQLGQMGSFGATALYRSLGCKLLETVSGDAIPMKVDLPYSRLGWRFEQRRGWMHSRDRMAWRAPAYAHMVAL